MLESASHQLPFLRCFFRTTVQSAAGYITHCSPSHNSPEPHAKVTPSRNQPSTQQYVRSLKGYRTGIFIRPRHRPVSILIITSSFVHPH
ncbi:hypothetical protein K458DRAFT_5740 [Lentithecium fluviatile CBS 122367]|uniref:Uncharacterized protein n=1 Tax=Lentithecium fluviatile CBS 122367 TaxID=1168545 RepID=A0A6G1JMT9_9PLEO|nr:hypothetical protein K458DRAFT_5740 [Lentithecium fluviatile CBS 122367]